MSSMKKIAEIAEVSLTTASFILNGKADKMRISKTTQEKVLKIAKELGYSPNIAARRLRNSASKNVPVIAILWTIDTRASLISRFLQGIHMGFLDYGSKFELLIQPYENSKLKNVKGLMSGNHFNGAIIANASDSDLEFLEKNNVNVPIVLYQRVSNNYSTVIVDSFKTGESVADLFYTKKHENVGIIQPTISSQAVQFRKDGFIHGAKTKGLNIESSNIVSGEFSEEGGYVSAMELLKTSDLPTAIFTLSDQMAIGALKAFNESGIKIPQDIELIGHDDNENAKFSIPSLSTVHLPVEKMANECVDLLLNIINQKIDQPVARHFETSIVFRDSCIQL